MVYASGESIIARQYPSLKGQIRHEQPIALLIGAPTAWIGVDLQRSFELSSRKQVLRRRPFNNHEMTMSQSKGKATLLPVPNRLESFWLSRRDSELKNARTTPQLPRKADVVIIGSGLSGAMMSYRLMREAKAGGRNLNVVMLEADETCGSATARNGQCHGTL